MNKVINISSNGIKQAIDDLVNENEMLQDKVYKLENIIKEVREQINKDREKKNYEKDGLMKQAFYCNKTDKLLEILDKVEEKQDD